jgi:hypothetical protein
MQRVGAVIGDQVIGLAAKSEFGAADAVGEAPGDRAEMAEQCLVFQQAALAQHDIVCPADPVRHIDLGNDPAIAEETHSHAVIV